MRDAKEIKSLAHRVRPGAHPPRSRIPNEAEGVGREPPGLPAAGLQEKFPEPTAPRLDRRGTTLRLIAASEDPSVARRILEFPKLPARAPPLEPASRAAIPSEVIETDPDAGWDFDANIIGLGVAYDSNRTRWREAA